VRGRLIANAFCLRTSDQRSGADTPTVSLGAILFFLRKKQKHNCVMFRLVAHTILALTVGAVTFDSSVPLTSSFVATDYPSKFAATSSYTLYWKILDANSTAPIIEMALQLKGASGWMAVGWQAQGQMGGSDIVLCTFTDGNASAVDMYADGEFTPSSDSTQNIIAVNGSQLNDVTTVRFRRFLNTGDTNTGLRGRQDALLQMGSPTVFIFAYNPSTTSLFQHPSNAVGSFSTVLSASGSDGTTQGFANDHGSRVAHAVMMITAWLIFVPSGIVIARYYKRWGHKWYQMHVGLQISAVLLTLSAFIVIVIAENPDHTWSSGEPLALTHGIFGIVITILAVLFQPLLGKLADTMWSPDRQKTPFWPDKLHWYVGRFVGVLALANIFMGVWLLDDSFYAYLAVVIILLICVLILCVYSARKHFKLGPDHTQLENGESGSMQLTDKEQ
jgi:hypothetical protein